MNIRYVSFSLILITFFAMFSAFGQFNGTWSCNYVTDDNEANGIGINCPSVGVISENTFVALAYNTDGTTNFLVGYTNADSVNGRMGFYPYNGGWHQNWVFGFGKVEMMGAVSIAATADSLIYVANNDASRNILVFKMDQDSVVSSKYRLATGTDSLWAIAVDDNGIVYVSTYKDSTTPGTIMVFNSIKNDNNWGGLHKGTPISTITMPEPGLISGIATNSDGSVIYASNSNTKKVYCFTGSPTNGYTNYQGFNFTLKDSLTDAGNAIDVTTWGLGFMKDKNLLVVACDKDFRPGHDVPIYEYGRLYFLNPNDGTVLDTIDEAAWNYSVEGSYQNHNTGHASGYTSVYSVAFDQNDNTYCQSYFGWTVDKWTFSGTLPTIPLTITGIKVQPGQVPTHFNLSQNYPNPFNPTTTIEFSIKKSSNISLSIYDINGRLVTKLINSAYFESGSYKINFDASKLASGTYIYVLKNGTQELSKKMTLLK